jgi:hypothetical protein
MYLGGNLAVRLAMEHPVVTFLWLLPAILAGAAAAHRGGSGALWWVLGFASGPLHGAFSCWPSCSTTTGSVSIARSALTGDWRNALTAIRK